MRPCKRILAGLNSLLRDGVHDKAQCEQTEVFVLVTLTVALKGFRSFTPLSMRPCKRILAGLNKYKEEGSGTGLKDTYSCIFAIIRLGTLHKKTY